MKDSILMKNFLQNTNSIPLIFLYFMTREIINENSQSTLCSLVHTFHHTNIPKKSTTWRTET